MACFSKNESLWFFFSKNNEEKKSQIEYYISDMLKHVFV
jgi:hypothetical protein